MFAKADPTYARETTVGQLLADMDRCANNGDNGETWQGWVFTCQMPNSRDKAPVALMWEDRTNVLYLAYCDGVRENYATDWLSDAAEAVHEATNGWSLAVNDVI